MSINDHRNFFGEILKTKNPFNIHGYKCYSQNDEDGLLCEIFRRLGLKDEKTFAEFGVGNGLECNSIQFLAQNWKGFWIGNESLAFENPKNSRLTYVQKTITLENLQEVIDLIKKDLGTDISFLSMDFDGNDAYFVKELLVLNPKVICVEYNANIAPPGDFCVQYDPNHRWQVNYDYYGASLQHYVNLLQNYKLICCNCTGLNAFFVRKEYDSLFPEVPNSIHDIFVPAIYAVFPGGHKLSTKTIESILSK